MSSIRRGIWGMGALLLLVSCSTQPAPVPLAPNTQVLEQVYQQGREQVYQQGRVAFKERRYEEAAVHFARVVAADPEHLKARLNWAAALSYLNKVAEAIVQCQNVLARDPTNAEAYYQWGAVLARAGKPQQAVEKFEQALALKPMPELLQDDPALQLSLQDYLKRQRREILDTEVVRPKPESGRAEEERIPLGRAIR